MCEATLTRLNYQPGLYSRWTPSEVVPWIPHYIQSKWFKRASHIRETKREPTFPELMNFVSHQADAAVTYLIFITQEDNSVHARSESRRLTGSQCCRDRADTVTSTETDVTASSLKICKTTLGFFAMDYIVCTNTIPFTILAVPIDKM
ncbi:hypothetical protein FGIG_10285 [Fasciola gigantica]|uniref:Uncharacterized protein n=1 Tax=Fasciola gigantica TaxID=46835 RepID=A0A504YME6_FASGI|nr:hypothetical protein FGIG_10285 [Fasciola gigantica]